jgi:hypothetical protein
MTKKIYFVHGAHPSSHQICIGGLSPEVKRPEREADRSPASSAQIKNVWNYNFTDTVRLSGDVLN